jgi:hypothetical protein
LGFQFRRSATVIPPFLHISPYPPLDHSHSHLRSHIPFAIPSISRVRRCFKVKSGKLAHTIIGTKATSLCSIPERPRYILRLIGRERSVRLACCWNEPQSTLSLPLLPISKNPTLLEPPITLVLFPLVAHPSCPTAQMYKSIWDEAPCAVLPVSFCKGGDHWFCLFSRWPQMGPYPDASVHFPFPIAGINMRGKNGRGTQQEIPSKRFNRVARGNQLFQHRE